MKTNHIMKMGLGLLLFIIVLISHNVLANSNEQTNVESHQDIDVNITISGDTSESDLEEIKEMLADNGIESEFTDIKRNDLGELLGITIKLSTNGNQTVTSSMANNIGLQDISFGRKDGQLYINQNGSSMGNFAFFNMPNVSSFQFDNDSIIKQQLKEFHNFNFDDFFGKDSESFFGNMEAKTIDELLDKMKSRFGQGWNGTPNQKFNFIDDPNTEKLIVIDGETSDFETLQKLATEDRLEEVDFLRPETAMSIYGKKAKDGAVIATTKTKKL